MPKWCSFAPSKALARNGASLSTFRQQRGLNCLESPAWFLSTHFRSSTSSTNTPGLFSLPHHPSLPVFSGSCFSSLWTLRIIRFYLNAFRTRITKGQFRFVASHLLRQSHRSCRSSLPRFLAIPARSTSPDHPFRNCFTRFDDVSQSLFDWTTLCSNRHLLLSLWSRLFACVCFTVPTENV